jgi:hypothetical protein
MSGNRAVSDAAMAGAARELLSLGADAFFGPAADLFVDQVGQSHPARKIYMSSTAKAIARYELDGVDAEDAAAEVFTNFIWTHFVCKLLVTAAPEATATFIADRFDAGAVTSSLDETGASILSCFHYTAYPLVALRLAMSSAAPLISKARVDVIERSGAAGLDDHLVYMSNRSAAIRVTRALRGGRSVWMLLDVVLPSVRLGRAEFLGRGMNVGAGLGKIARLSGRPCLPIFWELRPGGTRLQVAPPVFPAERSEEEIIQAFVDTQSAFVSRQPTQWLEWYSLLEEAPLLRAEVKQGNEVIWERLGSAFG